MGFSSAWTAMAMIGLVALTGCGEVAFKRGSGSDAFTADQRRCRAENADPDAVRVCLAKLGWHVADLAPDGAPAAPDAPAAASPAISPPALPAQQSAAGAAAAGPAAPPVSPPPARSPTALVPVGAWFKFGGGSGDLHDAVAACVAILGPDYAPAPGYHSVARALYACLGKHGWHGVGRSTS